MHKQGIWVGPPESSPKLSVILSAALFERYATVKRFLAERQLKNDSQNLMTSNFREMTPERFLALIALEKQSAGTGAKKPKLNDQRPARLKLADIHAKLVRTLESLHESPRIRIPELAGLCALYRESKQLLEAVGHETSNTETESQVSVELLAEMLNSCHRRLVRLKNQIQLFDHVDTVMGEYLPAINELIHQPTTTVDQFKKIAKRIEVDVEQCSSSLYLLPEAGCSLENYLCRNATIVSPELFASGLLTARLAAWNNIKSTNKTTYHQEILLAGLLADVGFLPLVLSHRLPIDRLQAERPLDFQSHPHVSAALTGGIRGLPLRVTSLVGQHHERLDGTGYPNKLRPQELDTASQQLQITVRFAELIAQQPLLPGKTHQSNHTIDAYQAATETMLHETRLGEFDESLVEQFLLNMNCVQLNDEHEESVNKSKETSRKLIRHEAHPLQIVSHRVAAELEQLLATSNASYEQSKSQQLEANTNSTSQKKRAQADSGKPNRIDAEIPEPHYRKRAHNRRKNMIRSSRRR